MQGHEYGPLEKIQRARTLVRLDLAAERLAALETRIVDLHQTVATLQQLRVTEAQKGSQ